MSVVFARRYLVDGGEPGSHLKYLLERGADRAVLRQLMLVYTARRNPVLRDFISEVFWPAFAAGAEALRIGEAEGFLKRAAVDGRIARPWSEVMRKRIAGDLLSTLADFGLLEDLKRPTKPIRSYSSLRAIRQRAIAQGMPLQSVDAIRAEVREGRAEAGDNEDLH